MAENKYDFLNRPFIASPNGGATCCVAGGGKWRK
jgi:hypothetical protein